MQYIEEDEEDVNEKVVWAQHLELFKLFYRLRGRWHYKQVPVGMSSVSMPYELNWVFAEGIMQRTHAIAQLSVDEYEFFFMQLEVMEAAALEHFHDSLNKQLKRK